MIAAKSHALRILFAAAAAAALVGSANAADTAQDARAVLDEAAGVLAGASSFRLESTVTYTAEYSDSQENQTTTYTIAVNRAGDIAVRVANENLDSSLYASGDTFVQYMPEFAQYKVLPRDASVPQILERASFEIIDPVVDVFASLAQFQSPAGSAELADLALIGAETIDGRECDHVQFTMNAIRYDLWIEKAPARLVRRIMPDMAELEAQYEREYGMDFEIAVSASLPAWEIDADVSSAVTFSPPDGAEKVERFGPKAPAEAMLNTPAPDFTLPLLDGGEFTLSKERGNIVILDFWATWCGPCRIGMPALSEVAKEFADQGVKLISIDLGEDPADVRAFLADMNLDITVALAADNTVPSLYKVEPIPQTTIVDREGIIRIVHIGLWAMPEFDPDSTQEEQIVKIHAGLADALRAQLRDLTK